MERDEYTVLGYDGSASVDGIGQLTGNDPMGGESWNLSDMIDEDDGIYYSEGVEVDTGVKPSDKQRSKAHEHKPKNVPDMHSVDSGFRPTGEDTPTRSQEGGPMKPQRNPGEPTKTQKNTGDPMGDEGICVVSGGVEPRSKAAEWLPCVEIQTHFAQRPLWTGAQFSLKTLQRPNTAATPYEGSLPTPVPIATDASVLLDDDMQEMNVDTSGRDPRPVPQWMHTGNPYDEQEASVVINSKAHAHDTLLEAVDMDSLTSALEEPMSTDDLKIEQPYVPDRDEGIVRTMFDGNRVVQTIGLDGLSQRDPTADAVGDTLAYGDNKQHDIIMQSMDVDVDTSYYKAEEPLHVRSRSTDTESEEEEPMLQPPVGITAHDVIINHVYDEAKQFPEASRIDAVSQIDASSEIGAGGGVAAVANSDESARGGSDAGGIDEARSSPVSQIQTTDDNTSSRTKDNRPVNTSPTNSGSGSVSKAISSENLSPKPQDKSTDTDEVSNNSGDEKHTHTPETDSLAKPESATTPILVVNEYPDADMTSSSTSSSSQISGTSKDSNSHVANSPDVANSLEIADNGGTNHEAEIDSYLSHTASPELPDVLEVSPEESQNPNEESQNLDEVSENLDEVSEKSEKGPEIVVVQEKRLTEAEIVALFSNTDLASSSPKESASRTDTNLSVETDGGSSTSSTSKKKKKKKKKKRPSRSNSTASHDSDNGDDSKSTKGSSPEALGSETVKD
ncbi:hypothetical protein SARC_09402 [Sphaeroforma arctica JP610]|uniref:Uncharacterized protein n=1 Tax=Sphaeroforma arctica JP610 TaxID=667725 RepID=A0A0L0FQ88_9EUKA|nr:hypothetical protein SARC_09402 [Sphaeroforma arctica JP610]KNC78158.1 hypothetical protein SARC_09402 [Sphaeroforma arctica JP610]|eukprot:XP_014152060.1 hypothetical protein SARC_09402 [Sphaeroforma arctica JP610]